MDLLRYFIGERLSLESPLGPEEVAAEINRAARFRFWSFSKAVVGRVRSGRVRLRYRTPFFDYNAKPFLAGRLSASGSGSRLELRFRPPLWVYPFYAWWYLVLLVAIVFLAATGMPESTGFERAMVSAGLVLMLFFPIVFHAIGTWNAGKELEILLAFLAEHAKATP